MRIMGLDVGSKTVGVAISDPLGFTAQGLEIIQINEIRKSLVLSALVSLLLNTRLISLSSVFLKI